MYIFLFIFIAIIYLSHFIFYLFLINFFTINNIIFHRLLLAFFAIMPLVFVASMAVMHSSGTFFVRFFYFISGLWHGMLVNFLIFSALSWFLVFILKIKGVEINPSLYFKIGVVAIFLSIMLSVYGFFNVFNLKVKEVSFNLKNLPEYWQGKKGVFISDVHLGSVLRSDYMERIADKIDKINPDIIFISGDLFDSTDGHLEFYEESLKRIKAPLGVYFVNGNHETYLGNEMIKDIIKKTDIKILKNELVDIENMQIIGIDYPERRENINITEKIKELENYNPEKTNVLLYHEPVQIDEIKKSGIDLMLSGHTHNGQMIPFSIITGLIFKGFDYGLFKINDFHLYVSSGVGVWGPTMRTSGRNEIVILNF